MLLLETNNKIRENKLPSDQGSNRTYRVLQRFNHCATPGPFVTQNVQIYIALMRGAEYLYFGRLGAEPARGL